MIKLICRLRPSSTSISKKSDIRNNIFTSTLANETPQTLVVSSKNAISQKIINDYLKNDQELLRHRPSIIENSDLFSFDYVFGEKTTQQHFYDAVCSQKIISSINGQCATFMIIGGNQSGKKFTLKGEEKGISYLAVENILTLFDAQKQNKQKFKLNCAIYCVNQNELIDLIGNTRSQAIKTQQIRYLSDFKKLLKQALFQYSNYMKELQDQQSHIFISLSIQKDKQEISKINFIIYNEFKKLSKEQYEQQTELCTFLSQINDLACSTEINYQQLIMNNKVFEALYVAFNQSKFQNINLIFQVSQIQNNFMEAYRTLQFADELKQLIKPSNKSYQKGGSQMDFQEAQSKISKVSFGNMNPEFGSKVSLQSYCPEKVPFEATQQSRIQKIGSERTMNLGSQQSRMTAQPSRMTEPAFQKQFQELKDLLKEKEVLDDHRVKKFEKDLKGEFEENIRLQNKLLQQEESLRQRDNLINELEKMIDENKRQIELDQQMYLTAKQKENVYESTQEELRDTVSQLNTQLRYLNEEIQMLRSRNRIYEQDLEQLKENELLTIKHYEKREDEFMKLMREEQERNKQLYDELEYFTKELKEKESSIEQLEENIKTLNKVIEDQCKRIDEDKLKNKELTEQLSQKGKKTDDVLKDLANFENRYKNIKSKLETENIQLKEDKDKYSIKYKEKLKKYKTALKQEEQSNQQLRMDYLKLQNENDQLYQWSKQLDIQLAKVTTETQQDKILQTQQNQQSELERYRLSHQQLNEQLRSAEYEITQLQQQLQSAIGHLERTNQEYEKVIQENQSLQRLSDEKKNESKQNEYMIERMIELSDKQMDEFEGKFNKLNAQINSLQHEKRSLVNENINLKQNLEQIEGNEMVLEKRIVKLRKENKELNKQLKDLNLNMRDMILEKNQDIKNQSMRQSRFSNGKMLSQNASYRSIRTNNLLMSGTKDIEDYDDDDDDNI